MALKIKSDYELDGLPTAPRPGIICFVFLMQTLDVSLDLTNDCTRITLLPLEALLSSLYKFLYTLVRRGLQVE